MLLCNCTAWMLYPAGLQKARTKNGDWRNHQRRFLCQYALFAPGTARYYETSSAGSGREPVCSGHCCGRLSLFGTYRVGTFSNSLWHCGKCHGCCVYFGKSVRRGISEKAAGAPSCHSFSILWDLPHSVRYYFPAADKYFYPLSDFAHHVLCLPAWM